MVLELPHLEKGKLESLRGTAHIYAYHGSSENILAHLVLPREGSYGNVMFADQAREDPSNEGFLYQIINKGITRLDLDMTHEDVVFVGTWDNEGRCNQKLMAGGRWYINLVNNQWTKGKNFSTPAPEYIPSDFIKDLRGACYEYDYSLMMQLASRFITSTPERSSVKGMAELLRDYLATPKRLQDHELLEQFTSAIQSGIDLADATEDFMRDQQRLHEIRAINLRETHEYHRQSLLSRLRNTPLWKLRGTYPGLFDDIQLTL